MARKPKNQKISKSTRRPKSARQQAFDKNMRTLVTPEGIDLRLRIADGGSRFGAFVLDLLIMLAALIALTYAIAFIGRTFGHFSIGEEITWAIWVLAAFFLRSFYFMFFEMGPRAATWGKRALKIRVANRNGGHLTPSAVFARNALRELEFFLPLGMVFYTFFGVDNGWLALSGLVWSFIFLLFPLFNKDRLRAGDLIAGTWVVQSPKLVLSKDLAGAPKKQNRFIFTQEQIDSYGVRELHVLENVLRKNDPKIIREVTERIQTKIKWADPSAQYQASTKTPAVDDDNKKENASDIAADTSSTSSLAEKREFLAAYYAALRGKLETKLLFGVRRTDKHDKR